MELAKGQTEVGFWIFLPHVLSTAPLRRRFAFHQGRNLEAVSA